MKLSFTPLDPVFLTIGPVQLHYYGLMYGLAFITLYMLLPRIYKLRSIKVSHEQHENLLLFGMIGALVGGRLMYVFGYNLSYFIEHPLQIFAIHKGGMASHGGFIGATIAGYLYTKKHKLPFLQMADAVSIPMGLGLALGRIGNLINQELYGRITNVPWCITFDTAEGCRHPSQIYAFIKNLSLTGIMVSLRHTRWNDGVLFALFGVLYSLFRFITEFFREPDLHIGLIHSLSQGQWLSLGMFAFFILLLSHRLITPQS